MQRFIVVMTDDYNANVKQVVVAAENLSEVRNLVNDLIPGYHFFHAIPVPSVTIAVRSGVAEVEDVTGEVDIQIFDYDTGEGIEDLEDV